MLKEIDLNGSSIVYDIQYKNVKNINLRIKSDGRIFVSANPCVRLSEIEAFIKSKSDYIYKALNKFENRAKTPGIKYFNESEIKGIILSLCEEAYPYFEKLGVKKPDIRFKAMVSQWGNCHVSKGILTFNTNLVYAPLECIEYIVIHEFTHFLQLNHSAKFYEEIFKIIPDYKKRIKRLKEISIR